MRPIIQPLGDHAITITFGDAIDEAINKQVLSFFDCLQRQKIEGVKDIIPAYASVTVVYDILSIRSLSGTTSAFDYMHDKLQEALAAYPMPTAAGTKIKHIPVCYDVSLGTDLAFMSEQKRMPIEKIVEIHSSATYLVYMTGFMPGFAYMGKVHTAIATPRKPTPASVTAGSVGIADFQTGIYPFDSPGGWSIVGQTPLKLFNKHSIEPCLLQPGDSVKFEPIGLEEFHQIKSQQ